MKDKVLQRKMFRQKALKKYGGDMLPKFNTSGLMEGEEEQGFFDRFLFPKEEVDVNEVAGLPSLAQPYDSRKAMLLAVAGRLLQADQRPGEGMFSGVGRGVGKAITEDFPTINKIKLADRAARAKSLTGSTAVNKTSVYNIETKQDEEVSFADYRADQDSGNPKYIIGKDKSYKLGVNIEGLGEIGDPIELNPRQQQIFEKMYGDNFMKIFRPTSFIDIKGEIEKAKALGDYKSEKDLENKLDLKYNENSAKVITSLKINTELQDTIRGFALDDKYSDKNMKANPQGASLGLINDFTRNADAFVSVFKETGRRLGYGGTNDLKFQDKQNLANDLVNLKDEDDIKEYLQTYEKEFGRAKGVNTVLDANALQRFAKMDAKAKTLMIELAYAIAKAREEGGRFSVSDIELAMMSIGNSSSRAQALEQLATLKFTQSTAALSPYQTDKRFANFFVNPDLTERERETEGYKQLIQARPETALFVNSINDYRNRDKNTKGYVGEVG
tara:strand:- start:3420 stop:4919 length:1500 start_codon:yes stop_codon:yes gene_type:complete